MSIKSLVIGVMLPTNKCAIIPIGNARLRNGIWSYPKEDATAFICEIPKSTYLKNPSNPKFPAKLIAKIIFLRVML